MSDDMTEKFRLFCRASGVWYIEDRESREQESLRTRDAAEAKRLFHAKNEAHRQPAINIQIAGAYGNTSQKYPLGTRILKYSFLLFISSFEKMTSCI
jgi:hypothetical protein